MNIVPLSFLLHEISTNVELEPKNLIHDGIFEEEESLAILDGGFVHLQNLQLQQVLILNRTLKFNVFLCQNQRISPDMCLLSTVPKISEMTSTGPPPPRSVEFLTRQSF